MIEVLLLVVAFPLLVLAAVYALELVAGCLSLLRRAPAAPAAGTPTLTGAILVPAHNEAGGIGATLDTLMPQLGPDDRLFVVADNCTDRTALVAAQAGATVFERSDPVRRGKGYALAYGLEQIEQLCGRPDVVLLFDADCTASDDAVRVLKAAAVAHQRPAQACYLIRAPQGAGLNLRVADFAFYVKNRVRCLGLRLLGAPVPLLGSGMAFPSRDIYGASLASGEIVEDMKLGVDFALAGKGAVYCPQALVLSEFPTSDEAIARQRERWEHGHLGIIRRFVPSVLGTALRRLSPSLLLFGLDLAVPPLTLLLGLLGAATALASLAWALGAAGALPALLCASALGTILLLLALCWQAFGRPGIRGGDILRAPLVLLRKFDIYRRYLRKPQQQWIRTERAGEAAEGAVRSTRPGAPD